MIERNRSPEKYPISTRALRFMGSLGLTELYKREWPTEEEIALAEAAGVADPEVKVQAILNKMEYSENYQILEAAVLRGAFNQILEQANFNGELNNG